jgi:hypothetical protein
MSSRYSNLKERRVVELRKQGMTYQQIAKEARISVRDIKPILNKYTVDDLSGYTADNDGDEDDSGSLLSISSRAYKLFRDEMMTPLEVAIKLNLDAKVAIRYHNEFLELNNRGTLAKLFNELEDEGISWLLRLYAVTKLNKLSINQIIECVSIYNEDLPMIKQMCEDANNDLEPLQKLVFQCENRVEYLNDLFEKLADDVKSKQIECEKADKTRREILGLTLRLRGIISVFKNDNETYRKIEQYVEKTVDRILMEPNSMKLLEFALISVLRSLPGNDQYKYRYLLHKLDLVEVSGSFDNPTIMPNTTTLQQIDPNTIVVRNNNPHNAAANQFHHSYLTKPGDYCAACYEDKILVMSKMYFEELRKLITDEIMTTISRENILTLRSS